MNALRSYPAGRDQFALSLARRRLSLFVIQHAEALRKQLGFGFVEVDEAPEDYQALMAAWQHSHRTLSPLPVFSGASDDTIYTSRAANWAFRYWHDVVHCQLRADFSLEGETRTAREQLAVTADRFGAGSLEYSLMEADTLGQVEYFQRTGGFVDNQLAFVSGLCEIAA